MEIVSQLIEQLGISEEQAKGGAGALFNFAKEKLGSGDFSKISEAVPGMDDLLQAAPQSGGLAGMVGGLASKLGGDAGELGGLASLAGMFSKLDLDSGMIAKFVPIILSFVQSKGGDALKNILQGVLK
jgi:hypothetical protein